MPKVNPTERSVLERAARLHWLHWLVVGLSLCLTLGAWHIARSQVEERIVRQFDREAGQVVELVRERMQRYEDALWSGVGLLNARDHDLTWEEWAAFTASIRIDLKYPGINGIGVIWALAPHEVEAFVAEQRRARPYFEIHPRHDRDVFYPITYIEPEAENRKAVGLDMAHESNRFSAALKARDTGEAQITGPIVLVQDQDRTPGFLFYAPFYARSAPSADGPRAAAFGGMVYAPFVCKRLMQGVLDKENRHVGIKLADGDAVLYDELHEREADYDPDPLFRLTRSVPMYGRTWTFDIASGQSFRTAQSSSQPWVILCGGIVIDALLLGMFLLLARANRRALSLADLVTDELQSRNGELEQFVYTASHDLKSPILTIEGFTGLMQRDLADGRHDRLDGFAKRIREGTARMRANVDELLELSRIGRVTHDVETVDPRATIEALIIELDHEIQEAGASVVVAPDTPTVECDPVRLKQLLENLMLNGLKHGRPSAGSPRLDVGGYRDGETVRLYVEDNGPGVPPEFAEKIFGLFERLQTDVEGTGIGLAIVRRITEVHGGRVWVEPTESGGARFVVSLPAQVARPVARAA